MAQRRRYKKPWFMYAAKLRKQFKARVVEVCDIVEVCDADGHTILPWVGFDATGLSYAGQKKLAQRIVDAVNGEK